MPITRADEYQHNNQDYAFVDSSFVRGGGRVVANLTALYALSTKLDQLKERITKVWVTAESAYYILIDVGNVSNSSGWLIDTGGIQNYTHIQGSVSSTWTINHNLGFRPSITVIDSGGSQAIGDRTDPTVNQTILTFSPGFSGTAYCS